MYSSNIIKIETKEDKVRDVLSYNTKNLEYRLYPTQTLNNDIGFKIDLVISEIPETNVFNFQISNHENFRFHYQPPLNIKFKNRSCTETECVNYHRPEHVVGSYAVYHLTNKNSQYKTGKAFHIYRPLVFDSKGEKTWGTLSFKEGVLSVIVSEDWLSKASYPVTIDPEFGYTEVGGSTSDHTQNLFHGTLHTSPATLAAYCGRLYGPTGTPLQLSSSIFKGTQSMSSSSIPSIPRTADPGLCPPVAAHLCPRSLSRIVR